MNELVLRDKSSDVTPDEQEGRGDLEDNFEPYENESLVDAPDGRVYVQQDANYNVTSLVADLNPTSGFQLSVVQTYYYDPNGVRLTGGSNWQGVGSTDSYHFGFTWQAMRWEGNVGLYKSMTRDYSPALGRWTSQDVAYFDGANLYEGMRSSPTTYIDPTGYLGYQYVVEDDSSVLGPYQPITLDPTAGPTTQPSDNEKPSVDPARDRHKKRPSIGDKIGSATEDAIRSAADAIVDGIRDAIVGEAEKTSRQGDEEKHWPSSESDLPAKPIKVPKTGVKVSPTGGGSVTGIGQGTIKAGVKGSVTFPVGSGVLSIAGSVTREVPIDNWRPRSDPKTSGKVDITWYP